MDDKRKAAVEKQHAKGKLTAWERADLLIDAGTYRDLDTGRPSDHAPVPDDGVLTGAGRIGGRPVCFYSQDFTLAGGSVGMRQAEKICRVLDAARNRAIPVICMNDSGGAKIQEGGASLAGYGAIFRRHAELSGLVPQVALILGPCAGGAAYAPALTDLTIMRRGTGRMFCTGPGILRTVLHEEADAEALGGADVHAAVTGEAQLTADSDEEVIALCRTFLSYLPGSCREDPPVARPCGADGSAVAVPDDPAAVYDMRAVLRSVADAGSVFELSPAFASNVLTALVRFGGVPCGIVANQPCVLAGSLDPGGADKAARFIRLLDSFGLPLVTFEDTPGFLPGMASERAGLLRRGAGLLASYAGSDIPKITVLLRKAYGGAYMAMGCREMGADTVLAWPGAAVDVMGPEAAAGLLGAEKQAEKKQSEGMQAERKPMEKKPEERQPEKRIGPSPAETARKNGWVDRIIRPEDTREEILRALREAGMPERRTRRRGSLPL